MKKHNFSFDLTGLQTYTDEVGGQVLAEAILKSDTTQLVTIQPGVKGTQAINLLTSTLNVQDGSCGWTTSGATEWTQRDITVCDYKVNEALCPKDLNNYWLSAFLQPGSYNESVPFEEQIVNLKAGQISEFIEDKIWNATSSGDCFSGLTEIFTGDSNVLTATTTAFTSASALSFVDDMISTLPDKIQRANDLIVMMSYANYRLYVQALRTANFFHYTPEQAGQDFITFHPATKVRVAPCGGIGDGYCVLGKAEYIIVGTDLMSDSETLQMFYSMDNDEVRLRANFKIGANIAFPDTFVVKQIS